MCVVCFLKVNSIYFNQIILHSVLCFFFLPQDGKMMFEQELYNNFQVYCPKPYFITFAGDVSYSVLFHSCYFYLSSHVNVCQCDTYCTRAYYTSSFEHLASFCHCDICYHARNVSLSHVFLLIIAFES